MTHVKNHENPCAFMDLPKIHKGNVLIRPLINFITVLTYKIAKAIGQIIKDNTNLKYNHSIKNSINFIYKLKSIKL